MDPQWSYSLTYRTGASQVRAPKGPQPQKEVKNERRELEYRGLERRGLNAAELE